MTDQDCATFLDALDAVVAGKDLPVEALEAIRRGAAALRAKGMLVKALECMVAARGCAGCLADPPPYVRNKDTRFAADEHAPECSTTQALAAIAEARKMP